MKAHKIVIINDEEESLNLPSRILTKADYHVVKASSGLEGLLSIQAEQPDIAIVDVIMPDINGLEICSLIKSDPQLKNTYVLLLSGLKITSESQAAGLEAGADDYITSPYSQRELLARVKNLISLKTAELAAKAQLDQQRAIARLGQYSLEDHKLPDLFALTVKKVAKVLDIPIVGIFRHDAASQTLTMVAGKGWGTGNIQLDAVPNSFLWRSLNQSNPTIVEDRHKEKGFDLPPILAELKIESFASVPMGNIAEPFGLFLVAARETQAFTKETAYFLQAVANILNNSIRRQNTLRALQQSAFKFSNTIEQANYGFTIVDENGEIIHWNAAQEIITGYERSGVIGKKFTEFFRTLVFGCERNFFGFEQLLKDISTMQETGVVNNNCLAGCIYDVNRRDGIAIKVHLAIFPIRTDFGIMICAIARDVTEEFERELFLRQQQRLATVGQISMHIAHEFNNFLAVISLYTEIMSDDPTMPPQHLARLKIILEQTGNAASLITQMLDFSRSSIMNIELIDLAAFLENSVLVLGQVLPKNMDIQLVIHCGRPLMKADPSSLQRMLLNLALNAQFAMPEGGKLIITLEDYSGHLPFLREVQTLVAAQWVVLRVQDTGTGIAPEIIDKVFDPFFSTKHPTEGTGMGLAQVYGIVHQHGGTISVDSEVNVGTSFKIYFPVKMQTSETVVAQDFVFAESEMSKGRILVVERNVHVQEALLDVFESVGYQVVGAKATDEGVSICRRLKGAFDLMIVDMVDLDAQSNRLLQNLTTEYPTIKYLFTTDHFTDRDSSFPDIRVDGLIYKPFNLNQVLQTIQALLEI
ncbi:MAG: response regulator [Chloroflexi bacterium]|nr:response regulator [Chloroflexota bacterium]MBP7044609.1 response regulator [Chloroflexota bacterium]